MDASERPVCFINVIFTSKLFGVTDLNFKTP